MCYGSTICNLSYPYSCKINITYTILEIIIECRIRVGDHRFTEKCNQDLFENRADRAMIIVSHSPEVIRAHCDHAALLENGLLQISESVEEAIEKYQNLS